MVLAVYDGDIKDWLIAVIITQRIKLPWGSKQAGSMIVLRYDVNKDKSTCLEYYTISIQWFILNLKGKSVYPLYKALGLFYNTQYCNGSRFNVCLWIPFESIIRHNYIDTSFTIPVQE